MESFAGKTTFNFHPLNKINDFVNTQYPTSIFYIFYLNPLMTLSKAIAHFCNRPLCGM